jgi:two-component system response regulator YesN
MYRMLIVDDEPDVLEALQAVFTAREDLELDILTASSAPEALAVLDRERLDILLSDICRPGMDGRELERRGRANWPGCRTIFLSGYTEFSYIYQAEQLEAVSYLLKTESRQRIVDTVRRTVAQLDEANRVSRLEQLADRAQVGRPYILRSLMEALIQDSQPEALARLIRKLQRTSIPTGRCSWRWAGSTAAISRITSRKPASSCSWKSWPSITSKAISNCWSARRNAGLSCSCCKAARQSLTKTGKRA